MTIICMAIKIESPLLENHVLGIEILEKKRGLVNHFFYFDDISIYIINYEMWDSYVQ